MASTQPEAGRTTSALEAYEPLAAYYDGLTQGYAHEAWVAVLEGVLSNYGLGGPRLLDVACGTGKSSLPWLRRGYDVTACDVSPRMVERARRRLGLGRDRVFVSDMRELPDQGSYDVVTCLDDSVNYLAGDEELTEAFVSMAQALRSGGALLFDCNSLATYRDRFVGGWEEAKGGHRFVWQGTADNGMQPGGSFTARLDVWSDCVGSQALVARSTHHQRHHPRSVICRALHAAGLAVCAVFGQSTGARLDEAPDEQRQPKFLYLAQKTASPAEEEAR